MRAAFLLLALLTLPLVSAAPANFATVFDSFPPDTPVRVTIDGLAIPITQLTLTSAIRSSGVIVAATVVQNAPDPGPAYVAIYEYLDISVKNLPSVTGATVAFAVPAAWLDSNDLPPTRMVLLHLTDRGWDPLETRLRSASGGMLHYDADVESLGTFAIAGSTADEAIVAPAATITTTTYQAAIPFDLVALLIGISLVPIGVGLHLRRSQKAFA